MSDWISVKDRMPEDGRPVLTCDGHGDIDIMHRNRAFQGWEYDDGIFYDDMFKGTKSEIKAWQSLPEPYKEDT